MELVRVTARHRNDFSWLGRCRHCAFETEWPDGYADRYYCLTIVPHRHCPKCGLDCYGEADEDDRAEQGMA